MSLPPTFRMKAPPGPSAVMRLVTIVLALMLVVLGVLVAHHAQAAQGETGHAVLAEPVTAHQPLGADGGASPAVAAERIAVTLATGCIVLIVCCALGLALLAARAWRMDLIRGLSAASPSLRTAIISATALTSVPRPSLVALSISRT